MELINNYIISLVTTIIFITAVEMIAPDNSSKKYIKFILGLILVAVLITPIISILTKGEVEVQKQIENFTKETMTQTNDKSYEEQKEKRNEKFIENLNKNTNKMLKEEFNKQEFESDIDCSINYTDMSYSINSITVGVSKGGIKTVKDISIGDSKYTSINSDEIENESEIKAYLAETFKVSEDKINLYKVD